VAVARLTTAGVLDTSFNGNGKVTTGITGYDASANAVAEDGLGRVVVAGYADEGPGYDFVVARYTAGGTLDSSFGGSGTIRGKFGPYYSAAYAVTVDKSNRVLVAGSMGAYMAVARFNEDGTFDSSFGSGGIRTIAFSMSSVAYGIALDSAGRI